MAIKVWEVKEGKIISLKHTNSKGENRLVVLKEPIAYDNHTLVLVLELGKALDLVNTYVTSVERMKDDIVDATEYKDTKKDNISLIIGGDTEKKDIDDKKKVTEDTEKIDNARSAYHSTDNLLRKLKNEIKPGAEVNTHDMANILGLPERNLFYHINKWIKNGDVTRAGQSKYKILEKDTRLATTEQMIRDRKDLYGR